MFVLLHVLYATVNELVTYILRYINVSNNNFSPPHTQTHTHTHTLSLSLSLFVSFPFSLILLRCLALSLLSLSLYLYFPPSLSLSLLFSLSLSRSLALSLFQSIPPYLSTVSLSLSISLSPISLLDLWTLDKCHFRAVTRISKFKSANIVYCSVA